VFVAFDMPLSKLYVSELDIDASNKTHETK